jgi:hypothetical protein
MQDLEYLSDCHRAYLLYCWADCTSDLPCSRVWRFAIARVPARERRQGLASLSDLVAFLQDELSSMADTTTEDLRAGDDDVHRHSSEPAA